MKILKKKNISRVLAAALAVTCIIPAGSVSAASSYYADVYGTAYNDAVAELTDEGILNGYEDGLFHPERNITRAEVSKIFGAIIQDAYQKDSSTGSSTGAAVSTSTSAVGNSSGASGSESDFSVDLSSTETMTEVAGTLFTDLTGSDWAAPYIGVSAACGIVNGYGNNLFIPKNNITYNELAAMAVRACEYDMTGITGVWPANYMTAADNLKIFNGTEGFTASTDGAKTATRGNTAIILNNVLDSIKAAASDGYKIASEVESTLNAPKLSISIDEAIEIMQTTGMNAETAEMNKKSDQALIKGYRQSASSISNALDASSYMDLNTLYTLQQSGITQSNLKITQMQRNFAETNLDANYQADMNNIEKTTRQLYYGILQAQENVEVCKDTLASENKSLTMVQKKNELGTASDMEVITQENNVTTAEAALKDAQQSLSSAQSSFDMLMGISTNTVLTLTTPLEKVQAELPSITDAVASMNENNLQLKYYDYLVDLTELQYTSLRYTTSTSSSSYLNAEISYEQAKLGIQQSRTSMETDLRTSYSNLTDLENQISKFESSINLLKKSIEVTQVQYNIGMATLKDVEDLQLSLKQAQQGLTAAIVSYNQGVSDFLFSTGVGTTRISF